MTSHYGVDCSSNNVHPLNAPALYAYLKSLGGGGQPFAIVKATQGTGYINPDFTGDVAALKAAGFAVGGYLMDQGNNDPGAEETQYRSIATGIPQFDDIELPEGLSVQAYIAHAQALVAQANVVQYLNQSEVAEGFPEGAGLWLADYNNEPGTTAYPCLIHQYSDDGAIPGAGGVFDLNYFCGTEAQFSALFGTPLPPPPAPVVITKTNLAARCATGGSWCTRADGTVDTFDGAQFYGCLVGTKLNGPIVGIAGTPTGKGYWLVGSDGGVYCFGDAQFYGSEGGTKLNAPVVGIAPTPTGKGYWLAASDGGIFTFGDAQFHGSLGGTKLSAPIVGIASPSAAGYWLVGSDGGIFTFGVPFYGSEGGTQLNAPVLAMQVTPSGKGYWLLAEDGGTFTFGDAQYVGPSPAQLTQWNLGQGHAIPITGFAADTAPNVTYTIFGDTGGTAAMPYRIA